MTRLHAELLAFTKWAELTDDEIHVRTKLGAHIRSTLLRDTDLFPSSPTYRRVGSTYAALELPDSSVSFAYPHVYELMLFLRFRDIDLNISTSHMDTKDRIQHRKFLTQMGRVLTSQRIGTRAYVNSTPLGLVLHVVARPAYGSFSPLYFMAGHDSSISRKPMHRRDRE